MGTTLSISMFSFSDIGRKHRSSYRSVLAILLVSILRLPTPGQNKIEMPDPRIPMRAIESLADRDRSDRGDQILLRGILTFSSSDRVPVQRLFIQDRTGAVEVETKDPGQ